MGQVFDATLPAVVAGTPVTQVITETPSYEGTDNDVARVMVTAPSTVAAQGVTNFATITVRQLRAGVVVTAVLAQLSVGANALPAETPVNVPIIPANPSTLQAGDVLDVQVTHTGTGGALPAGVVVAVELD